VESNGTPKYGVHCSRRADPDGMRIVCPGGSPHRLLRKSIRGGDEMVGDEYENRDSQIGPGSVFFESPFIVYSIRISNNVSDAP
jgi:hypothetical protein